MSRSSIPTNLISFKSDPLGTVTRQYALNLTNVYKLAKFLRHAKLTSDYIYNNQNEYIVGIRCYPVNVLLWFYQDLATALATTPVNIEIGPFPSSEVDTKGYYFGYTGSGGLRNLPNQKNIIKLATIEIAETQNNFMDYTRTKLYLYLPFYNWIELDTARYMGRKFSVYASIDFANGELLYNLCYGEKTPNDASIDDFIECHSVNIGIDISLSQNNANDILRNTYFNAFNLLGSAVGVDPLKAVGKGISATEKLMRGMEKHITKASAGSGRNKLICPTSIILVQDKANPVAVSSEWEHLNGYPLYETRTLSSLSGYTEVEEIHFNPKGEKIRMDEIDEIVSLLKSGVVL